MYDRVLTGIVTWLCVGAFAALVGAGCSKQDRSPPPALAPKVPPIATVPGGGAAGTTDFCDFKGGPETAAVKVVAFYPGRHEDTLAAVKRLLETFPKDVNVEIVDWRRPEGLKRRDESGLTCAGVTINGKNAFDLEVDGKTAKVLFVRGIDGEWTEADLVATVKQEVTRAAKP
jgi:hypothetical protein